MERASIWCWIAADCATVTSDIGMEVNSLHWFHMTEHLKFWNSFEVCMRFSIWFEMLNAMWNSNKKSILSLKPTKYRPSFWTCNKKQKQKKKRSKRVSLEIEKHYYRIWESIGPLLDWNWEQNMNNSGCIRRIDFWILLK